MTKTKRISEVINNDSYRGLLDIADKSRKSKKRKIEPKPIGHLLMLNLYDTEFNLIDDLFIDNATVCKSYTAIHIDKTHLEMLPFEIERLDIDSSRVTVYYKNGLSIELIRVNLNSRQ